MKLRPADFSATLGIESGRARSARRSTPSPSWRRLPCPPQPGARPEDPVEFDFATVNEAIAAAAPEREAVVFRERRLTHGELAERSRRLANYLLSRGVTVARERSALSGHESGQDHLAIYLYNGNEYLEGMLGAWKSRMAPLNVNYRYVEQELLYLFENSNARAILYHEAFAPRVAAVRERLPGLEILMQVADGSGNALLPGAVDYEEALAGASAGPPDVHPSPDDLYILYTGGTTGMPKGVLWRSGDIFVAAMGGRRADRSEYESLDQIVERVKNAPTLRAVIGPPLMHGAAQWTGFIMMHAGMTLCFPSIAEKLDGPDFLATIERERAFSASIVGDAFARPILDAMAAGSHDLSSLKMIGSGGAPLSTANKKALLEAVPGLTVLDAIGSSETGVQASNPSTRDSGVSTGDFQPGPGACVLSADLDRRLEPGDEEMGWFAQQGRVPLGYFGDQIGRAHV